MLVFAIAALVVKLLLAATSFGTADVAASISFSQGVREFGLLDMYGQDYTSWGTTTRPSAVCCS